MNESLLWWSTVPSDGLSKNLSCKILFANNLIYGHVYGSASNSETIALIHNPFCIACGQLVSCALCHRSNISNVHMTTCEKILIFACVICTLSLSLLSFNRHMRLIKACHGKDCLRWKLLNFCTLSRAYITIEQENDELIKISVWTSNPSAF